MGCCGCNDKVTCVCAAIFTFIQGVVWTALGVIAVEVYNCQFPIPSDTHDPAYYFILVYFYRQECQGIPSIISQFTTPSSLYNYTIDVQIPTWPNSTTAQVDRTFGIAVTYIVISAGWIITSLLLIVAAVSKKQGGGSQCMRHTWIIVTIMTLVMDLVSMVFYVIDITNTITLLELLSFLGVTNLDGWGDGTNGLSAPYVPAGVTAIPSIIMALVSARFIIIWFINLTFLVFVCIATRHATKDRGYVRDSTSPVQYDSRNNNNTVIPRPNTVYDYPSQPPPVTYDKQQYDPYSLRNQRQPSQDYIDGDTKLIRPQHTPGYVADRYSDRSSYEDNKQDAARVKNYPTVIRNQMPWSYFTKSNNAKVPIQPQIDNRPPVPVPDYDYTIPRVKKENQQKYDNYPERTPSDVSSRVRPSILKPSVPPRYWSTATSTILLANRPSDVMY